MISSYEAGSLPIHLSLTTLILYLKIDMYEMEQRASANIPCRHVSRCSILLSPKLLGIPVHHPAEVVQKTSADVEASSVKFQ